MSLNTLQFTDRLTAQLPADPLTENSCRSVENAVYSWVLPTSTSQPSMVNINESFALELGLDTDTQNDPLFTDLMSGNAILEGMKPYALCYGGHQFGQWAGQLGDGRAINLGEINTQKLGFQTLQLKGAGKTPYSRRGDGLAVLRSSIREYLCSEAMYNLGIPTTRALSLALTGDQVIRDKMYDGNADFEPCAVVCRVSPSFLRFGSIQLPASRGDEALVKQLVEFSINNDYPHLAPVDGQFTIETYLNWFKNVCDNTSTMIVHWMRVGFVHGVMNTDNMSLLGETIDYGPYGWIDNFDLGWTPNTTDESQKRYRFGGQFQVSQWNLFQLANAIFPLIGEVEPLQSIMSDYAIIYEQKWQKMMASKLGFVDYQGTTDSAIFSDLENLLARVETDMTLFYRLLSSYSSSKDALQHFKDCYYNPEQLSSDYLQQLTQWLTRYQARLNFDRLESTTRQKNMNSVNPKYVLRNYLAQQAIELAEKGDFSEIETLKSLLAFPYDEQPEYQRYAQKRPDWARDKVGCSMLSCSS
ncbi:YdiU family protein [Psychromonas sp. psych-6C06]|uniref:protein adenylyltransferase SelO n=1 Tax=Psychromonas sp. psych-6C06 TaxID=2058089 RepID=UPI000C34BF3F|nr:YdiU family protein [Psychromonas sp. psych-6C06]PKF63812.1 YdiU family protein [Psychromonas sp. psych-6C06]